MNARLDSSKSALIPINTICPECSGQMVGGVAIPVTNRLSWIPDTPKKTFFGMLVIPLQKCIPMADFRCEVCGFLKCYARKEFEPK